MAGGGVTPADEIFTSQLSLGFGHRFRTGPDQFLELRDDLFACSVLAYLEWVAPLRRATDVDRALSILADFLRVKDYWHLANLNLLLQKATRPSIVTG